MIHSSFTRSKEESIAPVVPQPVNQTARSPRSNTPRSPYELRRRIVWRTASIWIASYRTGKRTHDVLVVKTLAKPAKRRKIGTRQYRLINAVQQPQEVIIMARAAKKSAKNTDVVEDEEIDSDLLEELEELEESDDAEDEDTDDEDDDTEDDDEDDEEEAPAKKAKKAKKTAEAKPSRSRTTDGKVGTSEIAEAAGVTGRVLRMVLRKHAVEKDPDTGRYEWDSMKDKTVKQILKWIEAGEAKDIQKDALDKLKAKKAADKAAEAPATKKGKKGKKGKKVVEEDEDDE